MKNLKLFSGSHFAFFILKFETEPKAKLENFKVEKKMVLLSASIISAEVRILNRK